MFGRKNGQKAGGRNGSMLENVNETLDGVNRTVKGIDDTVSEANKIFRNAVHKGVSAAENITGNLNETIQRVRGFRGPDEERKGVVTLYVDQHVLDWLDLTVEGGMMKSRSDAAAFFVGEGLKAWQDELNVLVDRMESVRRAADGLRRMANRGP